MKKMMLLLMLSAFCLLHTGTIQAAAPQPSFLRWVVYTADTSDADLLFARVQQHNRLLEKYGATAVLGGQDSEGVIRYLEIFPDFQLAKSIDAEQELQNSRNTIAGSASVHILDAEPFLLAAKPSGTADKARMARLVIAPEHLKAYKKLLAEEMQAAVANEDGVLALLATTETARPNVFHLLELYRDEQAYRQHIAGKYFQNYNRAVQNMISEKNLIVNKPQNITVSGKQIQ